MNPPRNPEKKSERLGNFEGYWQIKLMTLEPYGLNDREEFFRPRSGGEAGELLKVLRLDFRFLLPMVV